MEAITLAQLLEAVHGTLLGDFRDENVIVQRVDTDSRTIHPGSLFIPLVGERFDGHAYINAALEGGALGCLTARERESYRPDRFYIKVASTQRALRDLAASHTAADLDTLRALQRQAEEAPDTAALAQALFRYHRGVTFLSGNTITPLLFNAFMQVNLEFWSGYIRSVGREESLRVLARFTDLIAAGQGDRAAQLLDDGLQRFVTTL